MFVCNEVEDHPLISKQSGIHKKKEELLLISIWFYPVHSDWVG